MGLKVTTGNDAILCTFLLHKGAVHVYIRLKFGPYAVPKATGQKYERTVVLIHQSDIIKATSTYLIECRVII